MLIAWGGKHSTPKQVSRLPSSYLEFYSFRCKPTMDRDTILTFNRFISSVRSLLKMLKSCKIVLYRWTDVKGKYIWADSGYYKIVFLLLGDCNCRVYVISVCKVIDFPLTVRTQLFTEGEVETSGWDALCASTPVTPHNWTGATAHPWSC